MAQEPSSHEVAARDAQKTKRTAMTLRPMSPVTMKMDRVRLCSRGPGSGLRPSFGLMRSARKRTWPDLGSTYVESVTVAPGLAGEHEEETA